MRASVLRHLCLIWREEAMWVWSLCSGPPNHSLLYPNAGMLQGWQGAVVLARMARMAKMAKERMAKMAKERSNPT